MKKLNLFATIFLAGLVMTGCSDKEQNNLLNEDAVLKNASVNGKYIVVLKSDAAIANVDLNSRNTQVKEKAFGLLKKYDITGQVEEVYETALQGFTVKMAPGQAKKLGSDANVKYIEADKVISLSPIEATGKPAPAPVAQNVPWGITRVNGGISGVGKTAWIIDSGIDLDHPDLTVDSRSKSFL